MRCGGGGGKKGLWNVLRHQTTKTRICIFNGAGERWSSPLGSASKFPGTGCVRSVTATSSARLFCEYDQSSVYTRELRPIEDGGVGRDRPRGRVDTYAAAKRSRARERRRSSLARPRAAKFRAESHLWSRHRYPLIPAFLSPERLEQGGAGRNAGVSTFGHLRSRVRTRRAIGCVYTAGIFLPLGIRKGRMTLRNTHSLSLPLSRARALYRRQWNVDTM